MKRFLHSLLAHVPFLACTLYLAWGQDAFARDSRYTLKVDDSPLPHVALPRVTSFADVLDKATPAVVGVYTSQVVRRFSPGTHDPIEEFLRRFYGLPGSGRPHAEDEKVPAGVGSGVIVAPEGYVLTNAHVVTSQDTGSPVDEIKVKLSDDRELLAEIIGFDKATDVAVLKVDTRGKPLPAVTLADSDKLRVGDVVFAAGNPLGVGLTVTMGIVSAKGRTDLGILGRGGYENFIQTDASINLGNSGGALIDARGRLVGINTAIFSRTGGNIGIGFAIPVNLARNVMVSLIEKGAVHRGFLGVVLEDLEPEQARSLKLPVSQGVLIDRVVAGSAAAKAGLHRGDVIVALSGKKVNSVAELRLAVSQTSPGKTMTVDFYRDGDRARVPVILGNLDDPTEAPVDSSPIPGVVIAPIDRALRERFGIPSAVAGLVVTESSGKAESLREGVVLVEINGLPSLTLADARKLIGKGLNRFYVWFKGRYRFIPYRVP